MQLQRRNGRGHGGQNGHGGQDDGGTACGGLVGHQGCDPSFQGAAVARHRGRGQRRGLRTRGGGEADQGAGIGVTVHLSDGDGVGRLLGAFDQAAMQHPDQGIEPEQGQGQPRQDQEKPVAATDVGHLMGHDGGGRLGPGQGCGVDQDGAGRQAPAQRTGDPVAGSQQGPGGGRERSQGLGPDLGRHRLAGPGPAREGPDPGREPAGDDQGPDGPGQGQGLSQRRQQE